ncbi:MAG: AAA family ATPase, partial [Candidatus Thiodiazotropha sp.]
VYDAIRSWVVYHLHDTSPTGQHEARGDRRGHDILRSDPPALLIIDEPELGMHPEAMRILGELITSAAKEAQLIIATQSPLLLDQFAIKDVIAGGTSHE